MIVAEENHPFYYYDFYRYWHRSEIIAGSYRLSSPLSSALSLLLYLSVSRDIAKSRRIYKSHSPVHLDRLMNDVDVS